MAALSRGCKPRIETKRESRFFCNYCDSCNNSSYAFNFVSVLVFVLRVVFYVTRYMYDARRQDFALSASFVSELKCFDGSEVTAKRQ